MDERIMRRIQTICAWSGLGFVIFYGITWAVLGHNYPPPDPKFSAPELVANYYLKYRDEILLGQSLSTFFGMFYLTWTVQLTVQMWQRERNQLHLQNHLLSLLNLTGGLLTAWVLVTMPVFWLWCAENAATANPELIKAFHFIGWYTYDMTYMITTIQTVGICAFIFLDKTTPALYPRWVGVLAMFSGLSFLPLTFLPYFKSGPFALNGYWSYHLAFISYALFTGFLSYYQAQDLKRVRISAALGIGQAISRSPVLTESSE
ncbi:MAG: hypothetical protein WA003_14785 [Desulfuromonadaceae bacterium]